MIEWPDRILQTGVGPIDGDVYLPAEPDQLLWGWLPCATDTPVLRVDPGTTVTVDTVSHEGLLGDQGRDPLQFFTSHGADAEQVLAEAVAVAASDRPHDQRVDGPHLITGPIAVTGARPGDLLRIDVLQTLPRVPYGVISNRHGRGALPEFPQQPGSVSVFARARRTPGGDVGVLPLAAGSDREVTFPLRPFLGILGVAAAGEVRPQSVPPGPYGGNIDINLLTVGSTLYLPVQVPDALFYTGDPHFAQGDGEVSLTALEASLRATVRLDVIPAESAVAEFGELVGPLARTAEYLVPTGMDPDLDVAMQNCVRAAIALLQARFGMDAAHAYAYLSAATDFDISQVVDVVKGVHARIRLADFAP
jgi:acetamidase/formamidase